MKPSLTRVLAVVGAALVLMIGGAVAYATTTTAPGTVSACVLKSSGIVRILSGSDTCRSTETPLSWNQAGVPGTPGTNGVSGYEMVTNDRATPNPVFTGVSVACPAGKKVLGGGWVAIGDNGREISTTALNVHSSQPTADGSGWVIGFNATSTIIAAVRVYATCATVTP